MKVEIELIKTSDMSWGGWKVTYGEKYADRLCWEEMLGLVSAITMPDERMVLNWLKTEDEHNEIMNESIMLDDENKDNGKKE